MTAQAVELRTAVGKLLCTSIFHASGKKLLAKRHQISEEDVELLDSAGHDQIWVAVLEESEVPEDEAASRVAGGAACGSLEIRVAAGGRANLFATENSCLLVDEALLRALNRLGRVTVATAPNFSFILAGQRAASVKTTPFAVPRKDFEEALSLVTEQGPLLQARPIGSPTVAVLYSDPIHPDRGRQLFEGIMRTRLERMGVGASLVLLDDRGRNGRGAMFGTPSTIPPHRHSGRIDRRPRRSGRRSGARHVESGMPDGKLPSAGGAGQPTVTLLCGRDPRGRGPRMLPLA